MKLVVVLVLCALLSAEAVIYKDATVKKNGKAYQITAEPKDKQKDPTIIAEGTFVKSPDKEWPAVRVGYMKDNKPVYSIYNIAGDIPKDWTIDLTHRPPFSSENMKSASAALLKVPASQMENRDFSALIREAFGAFSLDKYVKGASKPLAEEEALKIKGPPSPPPPADILEKDLKEFVSSSPIAPPQPQLLASAQPAGNKPPLARAKSAPLPSTNPQAPKDASKKAGDALVFVQEAATATRRSRLRTRLRVGSGPPSSGTQSSSGSSSSSVGQATNTMPSTTGSAVTRVSYTIEVCHADLAMGLAKHSGTRVRAFDQSNNPLGVVNFGNHGRMCGENGMTSKCTSNTGRDVAVGAVPQSATCTTPYDIWSNGHTCNTLSSVQLLVFGDPASHPNYDPQSRLCHTPMWDSPNC